MLLGGDKCILTCFNWCFIPISSIFQQAMGGSFGWYLLIFANGVGGVQKCGYGWWLWLSKPWIIMEWSTFVWMLWLPQTLRPENDILNFGPIIHPSISPSIRPSIHLPIFPCLDASIHLSLHPSIPMSIETSSLHPSIHLSLLPSIDPFSFYPSICLFIHPSKCHNSNNSQFGFRYLFHSCDFHLFLSLSFSFARTLWFNISQ